MLANLYRRFFSLTARPHFLAVLCLAGALYALDIRAAAAFPGSIGYPNLLAFDFWQGRSAAGVLTVGSASGNTTIQTNSVAGGTLLLESKGTNSVIALHAGDATGTDRTALSCDGANGCTVGGNYATASAIFGNTAGNIKLKGGSGFGAGIQSDTANADLTCKSGGTCDGTGDFNLPTLAIGGGTLQRHHYQGSASVTFASMAAGASNQQTISTGTTGLVGGMMCHVNSGAGICNSYGLDARAGTNNLVVQASNASGAVCTPGAVTIYWGCDN